MTWLLFFIDHYPHFFYLAAFVAMFIEGDFALLLFGGLAKGGFARFSILFLVACAATLIHDYIFWRIGTHLARFNKKKYLCFDLEKLTVSMERFRTYVIPIVFFSKFIWNFNRIILVSTGYLKIPYKKIFLSSFGSACVWPLAYMSIGYVFADQLDIFRQRIETVILAITGVVLFIIVFELYIRKFIMKLFFNN